ncbi:hypothetical protein, partial [Klebsiella aerogenes]|uniref:hypothetical protein n=1 Tax=Klebsiella aerogenes TaxID=548 RepID=UPI001CC766E8
ARLTSDAEWELLKDKRFITVFSTMGPDGDSNKAKWRVVAVPKSERSAPLTELKARARTLANAIPGSSVTITDPPFVEGAMTEAPIMLQ